MALMVVVAAVLIRPTAVTTPPDGCPLAVKPEMREEALNAEEYRTSISLVNEPPASTVRILEAIPTRGASS